MKIEVGDLLVYSIVGFTCVGYVTKISDKIIYSLSGTDDELLWIKWSQTATIVEHYYCQVYNNIIDGSYQLIKKK